MWVSKRNSNLIHRLIELYTQKLTPVSSEELAQTIHLAPSTIRKELQQLEKAGWITKQNTSSGRIPSNKAIRAYIKASYQNVNSNDDSPDSLGGSSSDFSVFSRSFLTSLSEKTGAIGFVLFDSFFDLRFRSLQIHKTSPHQIMVTIQALNGLSFTKRFTTQINYPDNSLRDWEILLTAEFAQKSLNQTIRSIRSRITRDRKRYIQMYRELFFLLTHHETETAEFLCEREPCRWHHSLRNHNDYAELLDTLSAKQQLTRFLLELKRQSTPGLHITFGDEIGRAEHQNILMIASHVFADDRAIADVGIIGPRYMRYSDSLTHIHRYSELFSQKMTGSIGRSAHG